MEGSTRAICRTQVRWPSDPTNYFLPADNPGGYCTRYGVGSHKARVGKERAGALPCPRKGSRVLLQARQARVQQNSKGPRARQRRNPNPSPYTLTARPLEPFLGPSTSVEQPNPNPNRPPFLGPSTSVEQPNPNPNRPPPFPWSFDERRAKRRAEANLPYPTSATSSSTAAGFFRGFRPTRPLPSSSSPAETARNASVL